MKFVLLINGIFFAASAASASSVHPLGLGFDAPTVLSTSSVYSPAVGEIVYQSSDETFYGKTLSSGWQPMGGAASGNLPAGAVMTFAGATCPTGYLAADGKSYSQTGTKSVLFAAISHSAGDGSTGVSGDTGCPAATGCFNAPDYRGRFLRGANGSTSNDPDSAARAAMATGGSTGNNVGSVQTHATSKNGLSISDPGHQHTLTLDRRAGGVYSGITGFGSDDGSFGAVSPYTSASSSNTSLTAGDNETRPINAYVNYCIKY